MTDVKTLQQTLVEELGRRAIDTTEIPTWLTTSLNPRYPLRPYQIKAFQFFLNYWNEAFKGKPRDNHQLLFHMATGSGKTMMMAGLMLALYEQGYRHFLFFVNSTNIIEKTRDNFLNVLSTKYLFAHEIAIEDKRIEVTPVDNFQSASPDDISIVFSTIQGLHLSLNTPREDALTYEDFNDDRIVLISDEAHHINADTKRGQSAQDELFESESWEGTVERIFRANPNNVLLEFTATVDLSDDNLAAKYKPKLIFDYPLKEFRKDGYSKEVKVLQADLDPFDRALQAVLLSQYRRKLFEKHKKWIKPVILFKSKTIKDSQAFLQLFKERVSNLAGETLTAVRARTDDPVFAKMFAYFDANEISMDNLAIELREDFSENKLISVNSKEESEAKQLAVNSLEDERNEYRAVFAVDKLNEGWDVLNLFDIARLYDTRDAKRGKVGKTTMSEAQLIGRGARYCPFQLSDDQPLYGRKYDDDIGNELRVCEELYYHSAYNPKYVQELNTALQEIGIKPRETRQRALTLKGSFRRTALFKKGKLFTNERFKYSRADSVGLEDAIIGHKFRTVLRTGFSQADVAFDLKKGRSATNQTAVEYLLTDLGTTVLQKAIQRLSFYEFANLREYFPTLESIKEFIDSPKYLGAIRLEVVGLSAGRAMTADEKTDASTQTLSALASLIVADKVEYKGSTAFKPTAIREVFTDKTLNFALDDGGDREFGRSMNDASETAHHLDLKSRPWYVFNDCFGTSEEKLLVQFINNRYDGLRNLYSQVYLFRNERYFKLYNFADGRAIEPDFVLYLIGKEKNTIHYQIFIEPKGGYLLKTDEWKEQFLMAIKSSSKIEQLFSNTRYVVWGLPFFSSELRKKEFEEAFSLIDGPERNGGNP